MLRLLGAIEAGDANSPPEPISTPRLRLVLAVLGAHAGRRVSVDRLMDALWPEGPPPTATTALQGYISKVRRRFEPDLRARGESSFVRTDADAYVLDLPSELFDITQFSDLAHSGLDADDEALLVEALGVWRGEPFAEFADSPWALGYTTELRQLRLRTAQRRYALAITAGRDAEVVDALRVDLEAHPFEERLAGLLMTALYRLGDQRGALEVFASTRERLLDELGLDPTPDLRDLERLILQHDASLLEGMRIRPPATSTPAGSRPAMFGRADDLERLTAALAQHRLVTLSGPGGVGKTRLAQEFVDRSGNALFVDLSASSTADDALGRLRAALDVDGDPLTDVVTSTALAANASYEFLVFDNCEHLLPALAGVISDLLAEPGAVRIVATSRQSLGLAIEHTIRLDPLPAPDAAMSVSNIAALPGMRILVGRSGQEIDEQNVSDYIALHRRLDGLPLALQLAAFRLRTLGVADLDPNDDQTGPAPTDFPERHRSLERVLAEGIDALEAPLRHILESMSVFAGPVPLEAIVRLLRHDSEAVDVRIGVGDLVDRSLVAMTATPKGVRYGLLETVRSRCRRSLTNSDALVDLHGRHADLVRRSAASSAVHATPQLALDDLDDEVAAALGRFERAGDDAQAHFGVLIPVATHWYGLGRVSEARLRLRAALDLHPGADPFLIGTASGLLGMISFGEGAFDELAHFTGIALEILEPLGLPGLDFVRAGHHVGRGEIELARASIEKFLDEPSIDARTRLAGLEVASTAAFFADDLDAAIALHEEQNEIARRERDHYFEAHALRGEALMRAIDGRPDVGLELCRRANEIADHHRADRTRIEALATAAVVRARIGDVTTAGADAWETLERCVRNFDGPAAALTVPIAAAHALDADDAETVARIAGWFDALCSTTGLYAAPSSRRVLDDVVSSAEGRFSAADWIRHRADGAALGLSGVLSARIIAP